MKRGIRALVHRLGWDLQRTGWEGWGAEKLRRLADPATVIDVGVCDGTPELYAAFPDARLLLVDPLEEVRGAVADVLERRPGDLAIVAVGDAPGEATLAVTADRAASSLHDRVGKRFDVEEQRTVPVQTLDDIVARFDPPAPFLLKVDTEGHELAVLRGGAETLRRTDCVIAELSVAERFADGYRFADVVAHLASCGFHLTDLLTVRRDPSTRQVLRLDAAFTRR